MLHPDYELKLAYRKQTELYAEIEKAAIVKTLKAKGEYSFIQRWQLSLSQGLIKLGQRLAPAYQ